MVDPDSWAGEHAAAVAAIAELLRAEDLASYRQMLDEHPVLRTALAVEAAALLGELPGFQGIVSSVSVLVDGAQAAGDIESAWVSYQRRRVAAAEQSDRLVLCLRRSTMPQKLAS